MLKQPKSERAARTKRPIPLDSDDCESDDSPRPRTRRRNAAPLPAVLRLAASERTLSVLHSKGLLDL